MSTEYDAFEQQLWASGEHHSAPPGAGLHRKLIADTGRWAAAPWTPPGTPAIVNTHVLGEPRPDLAVSDVLGPESAYVVHLHPFFGWIAEFQIDGSRVAWGPHASDPEDDL